jgi:hypothetical protein
LSMRESKKGEKTHLPKGSTEVWLRSQKPAPSEAKHKNPPGDSYEAWVEKRVEGGHGAGARGRKQAPHVAA